MPPKTKAAVVASPYLDARREWNDRFGDAIAAARRWQLVALISLAIALVGGGFGLYQAGRIKFVPYVVEVDKLGTPVFSRPIEEASPVDSRVTRSLLGEFVNNWRSVTVDVKVQEDRVNRLYAFLAKSDPAITRISDYFKTAGNSPFERGRDGSVAVEILSVVQQSDRGWQVDWREIRYGLNGSPIDTKTFRALANVTFDPPQDERAIRINPVGLYVTDINWSQVL